MAVGSQGGAELQSLISCAVLEQVRSVARHSGLDCEPTLDTSLYDVGLDSLARMEVVNRLEEAFQVRFSEESLYDLETCRDVIQLVHASLGRDGYSRPAIPLALQPTAGGTPSCREVCLEDYDVASFPECVAFRARLTETAAAGLENPFFRVIQGVRQATASMNGRDVISYTSFDYLGMASHPQVIAAAKEAIDRFGTSASASRLVGGNLSILEELDEEIARFVGTEAAAVFPSGYGTNASLLGHLFGSEDLILYDELAHNSIVQGSLLSKAGRRTFPHNNFEFLDQLLADIRRNYRRVVVAIEGVYSMDGDYPDLPHLIEVKQRHRALLYVDEAHSIGVMGIGGRGICEHFGVSPDEGDLWMGTISKALGSGGGYIAGRKSLIEYLKYTTPAFVFATASSPANAAAALAAVRIIQQDPEHLTRLRERSQLFLKLAHDCGLDTGRSNETPVIPIILGDSARCLQVSHQLLLHGINAQPILYPAVPESTARIRFFITANHTEEQICRTVQVLADCIAAR